MRNNRFLNVSEYLIEVIKDNIDRGLFDPEVKKYFSALILILKKIEGFGEIDDKKRINNNVRDTIQKDLDSFIENIDIKEELFDYALSLKNEGEDFLDDYIIQKLKIVVPLSKEKHEISDEDILSSVLKNLYWLELLEININKFDNRVLEELQPTIDVLFLYRFQKGGFNLESMKLKKGRIDILVSNFFINNLCTSLKSFNDKYRLNGDKLELIVSIDNVTKNIIFLLTNLTNISYLENKIITTFSGDDSKNDIDKIIYELKLDSFNTLFQYFDISFDMTKFKKFYDNAVRQGNLTKDFFGFKDEKLKDKKKIFLKFIALSYLKTSDKSLIEREVKLIFDGNRNDYIDFIEIVRENESFVNDFFMEFMEVDISTDQFMEVLSSLIKSQKISLILVNNIFKNKLSAKILDINNRIGSSSFDKNKVLIFYDALLENEKTKMILVAQLKSISVEKITLFPSKVQDLYFESNECTGNIDSVKNNMNILKVIAKRGKGGWIIKLIQIIIEKIKTENTFNDAITLLEELDASKVLLAEKELIISNLKYYRNRYKDQEKIEYLIDKFNK